MKAIIRALLSLACALLFACDPGGVARAQGCQDCAAIKADYHGQQTQVAATATASAPKASATAALVRVVLYWMDGCGHCHEVLDGILPQMQQKYGAQLEVRLVEVVTEDDIARLIDVAGAYGFEREQAGVPFLIIGQRALVGPDEITAELPGLIEASLAAGGVDWPALPVQTPAGQTAVPSDDSCGFAAPCVDGTGAPLEGQTAGAAATGEAPVTGSLPDATQPRGVPAPAAALGLAAVIGGGLAGALRIRAVRHRHPPKRTGELAEQLPGDSDAA